MKSRESTGVFVWRKSRSTETLAGRRQLASCNNTNYVMVVTYSPMDAM